MSRGLYRIMFGKPPKTSSNAVVAGTFIGRDLTSKRPAGGLKTGWDEMRAGRFARMPGTWCSARIIVTELVGIVQKKGRNKMARGSSKVVALEARLEKCSNVITLGVKPNWNDYSPSQRKMILEAGKVYYPSSFYAELLDTLGLDTFPSINTYRYGQDKIRQTALFQMAGISHPFTRIFYGRRRQEAILDYFELPFVAKVARGSAMGRGVYLIRNRRQLHRYCRNRHVAYIQQYLPVDRDLRVVVIGGKVMLAYWRIAALGEFRSNVARGGRISFEDVPDRALELALSVARTCGWDDVGIDLCCFRDRFYVLEANMKYGRQGFIQAGLDYHKLMEELIQDGSI